MSLNLSQSNQAYFARFPTTDYAHHEPMDTGRYRKLYQNAQYMMNVGGQVLCNTLLTSSIIVSGSLNAGNISTQTYYLMGTFGPFPVNNVSKVFNGSNQNYPLLYILANVASATTDPVQFHFITRGPLTTRDPSIPIPGQRGWVETRSTAFQWNEMLTGSVNIFSGVPATATKQGGFKQLLVCFDSNTLHYQVNTFSGSNINTDTRNQMIMVDVYLYIPTGGA